MKKIIVILTLVVVVSSCCNNNIEKKESLDIDKERENVSLVLEKYVIANERQDVGLVKEIWANNPHIVVFGTTGDDKFVGWSEIQEVMQRQFNTFQETYISVRDQVIEVSETGKTAWFSEIVNYNYIYQGEPKQYEGLRFTGVLEKTNGDWYIVQSHMSVPESSD
jgi:ketosteroid isomerase-like protein